jgi:hypothetical protein
MKNDKDQNIMFALIALGFVLVGITIYTQSNKLAALSTRIDRFAATVGSLQEQPGADLNQVASTVTEPPTVQASATTNGAIKNDAGASFEYGDFTAWLPSDWVPAVKTKGHWTVTDSENEEVATVFCPSLVRGFEEWDIAQSERTYSHNGKMLYAGKWVGILKDGSKIINNFAVVWGASPDKAQWGGAGCEIGFKVSSPPSSDELDRIETIYQSIR